MSSKLITGTSIKITDKQTGEVLYEAKNATVTMKRKRLKKDCPCPKCAKWRAEKICKKLRDEFEKAFVNVSWRTPVIDKDVHPINVIGVFAGEEYKPAKAGLTHGGFLIVGDKDESKT